MESFEQISTQYTPMIYSIIGKLNIYHNKDEFFQLGLIAIWEAYKRFNPEKGDFTNYAYSYIKGRLQTEMTRSTKRHEREVPAVEELWEYIVDECTMIPLEEDTLLSYCRSSGLNENQTKWVLYYCLHNLGIKEIAAIEGVALSTVKNWRADARGKLRTTLGSEVLW